MFTENKNNRQVAISIPASLNAHEKQADQFTIALAIMAKDVYIAPDIEPKPDDWMPLAAGWERFYTYNLGGCLSLFR